MNLHERAAELRSQGLTEIRVFRMLKREFPNAERDLLVRASRIQGAPTGCLPSWAQRSTGRAIITKGELHHLVAPNGGILRPVIAKRPVEGA